MADQSKCDVRFVEYLFRALRDEIQTHAYGTVQENINLEVLRKLKFLVPELTEQRRIADFLELFDDRMQTLQDVSSTLESIAQAIFQSWFMDLDPIREKAEGREPDGMDAETAALFPTEFEESDLGPIPKGWQSGVFGDLAGLSKKTINPQSQPGVEFDHYSLPAFDAGHLPVVESGDSIKSNKTRVPQGAVLMSKLNPHIPRVWLPGDVSKQAICSTEFLPWIPHSGASRELLYCLLKSSSFMTAVQALVTGTSNSHQRVNAEQVANLPVVIPPRDVMLAFRKTVEPILARAVQGRYQGQALAALLAELLPRLISGQLRVPEAQEAAEEALA